MQPEQSREDSFLCSQAFISEFVRGDSTRLFIYLVIYSHFIELTLMKLLCVDWVVQVPIYLDLKG